MEVRNLKMKLLTEALNLMFRDSPAFPERLVLTALCTFLLYLLEFLWWNIVPSFLYVCDCTEMYVKSCKLHQRPVKIKWKNLYNGTKREVQLFTLWKVKCRISPCQRSRTELQKRTSISSKDLLMGKSAILKFYWKLPISIYLFLGNPLIDFNIHFSFFVIMPSIIWLIFFSLRMDFSFS